MNASLAALLISIFAACMVVDGGDGAVPDKEKVYRELRARYDKLSIEGRETTEGRRLREKLSEACAQLIKQELPIGTTETKLRETLGPPWGEFGAALVYPGKTKNYFHKFVIVGGKVSKYTHGVIRDIER